MVTVDNAVIARLTTHGMHFEVLVDLEPALSVRSGANVDMNLVLAAVRVFSDSKKGLEASETAMKQIFGTSDAVEVAREIIKKGELQITAEYKAKLRERKKKQIIDMIHRNGIDPKTNYPHPPARIESAMEEAKVHIDEYADVQKQVQEALKKIRLILPIKFAMKEIAIKIPAEYAAKSYSVLNLFGRKIKEEWQNDGSLVTVIEIPGGLEQEMYDKLNSLCHGNIESKVLNVK